MCRSLRVELTIRSWKLKDQKLLFSHEYCCAHTDTPARDIRSQVAMSRVAVKTLDW